MMNRLIKIIVSIIYLIYVECKNRISLFKNQKLNNSCIFLYYHSIPDKFQKNFINQLDYIQKKTIPININLNYQTNNNKRYSVLTFDDAFQSVFLNALPELYKRNMPSIIFAPVGCLGQKPEWLKDTDHRDKNETIASAAQLQELNKDLVLIGSHSLNHANLATLNESELYQELYESKKQLEQIVSYPVINIAFPFGSYSKRVLNLCKETGYKQVFTTKPYTPYLPIDEFEKGRIGINPWDWTLEYRLKILGGYSWMPYISRFKKNVKYFFLKSTQ